MKQKVAIIATLLTLFLCIGFLGAAAGIARSALNESALEEIDAICRLSAQQLDSAAFDNEEGLTFLRQVASASGMVFTIYNQTGETLYTNRPYISDTLPQARLSGARQGEVTTFTSANALVGGEYLYALTKLAEGSFLCLSRSAYSLYDALGGNTLLLVLAAMAAALAVLGMMLMANNRTDRLVNSVMRVLEDFSEGQFDSRITGEQGDSLEQVARFNEIIGRIQDRVFRQKTRNQALSTVLNGMQNGILAVDKDLNVILVTPSAKQLLRIVGSPEGMPIQAASKDVKLDAVLRSGMEQEGVYTKEVAVRASVGRGQTPIRLYITPMMKDNQVVGAVALVEDVTELRRLEQVRTDFAANVSHELKTPLTSIKGFVETLQNGAIENPEMAQKFLRIIMLEADRLTRLINDILTVSKLESGKDAAPNERIKLDEMADDVSEMLRILASEKQVAISCNHPQEHSVVMGNADRVEQMLINLIENAIKYNKQGGSVTVSLYNTPQSVNLSISDTGIGIPEENIPRLFERFYRVDKGRSQAMGGTGLGLSIVKHIVKSMNGMIEVHSKVNEGTEFLITLPRVDAAAETQVEEQLNG